MNTASQTSRDGNAIAQLDREWNAIADHAIADALTGWQQYKPIPRPFSSRRRLLGFLHAAEVSETDAPPLALAASDRLAGRLVLQAFPAPR